MGMVCVFDGTMILLGPPSPLATIFEMRLQLERDLELLTQYGPPEALLASFPASSRIVIFSGTVELALNEALRCTGTPPPTPPPPPPPIMEIDSRFSVLILRVGEAKERKVFILC